MNIVIVFKLELQTILKMWKLKWIVHLQDVQDWKVYLEAEILNKDSCLIENVGSSVLLFDANYSIKARRSFFVEIVCRILLSPVTLPTLWTWNTRLLEFPWKTDYLFLFGPTATVNRRIINFTKESTQDDTVFLKTKTKHFLHCGFAELCKVYSLGKLGKLHRLIWNITWQITERVN